MTLQITGYVSIPVTNDEGVQILKNVKQFRSLTFNYVSTPPSDDVTASTDMEITIARYPLSLNDPGVPIYWTGTTDTEETLADGSSCGIVLSRPGSYHIHAEEIDRGADDAIVETYDVYIEVLSLKDGTTCAFPTETTEFDETSVKEGWSRKMEYTVQRLSAACGNRSLVGFPRSGSYDIGDLVFAYDQPTTDAAYTNNTDQFFLFSDATVNDYGKLYGVVIDKVVTVGDEVYDFPDSFTEMLLVAFVGKFLVRPADFTLSVDPTSKAYFFDQDTFALTVDSTHGKYIGKYWADSGVLLIEKPICNESIPYNIVTDTVAPSAAPNRIGQVWIDSVLDKVYVAKGTSAVGDWIAVN